jgi:anti-anti-sigma factor
MLKVTVKETKDKTAITLSGEAEMTAIKEFARIVSNLCSDGTKPIEIDLLNVTYIDSTGMGILLNLYQYQKKHNLGFSITRASPHVTDLISLFSLSEVLQQH